MRFKKKIILLIFIKIIAHGLFFFQLVGGEHMFFSKKSPYPISSCNLQKNSLSPFIIDFKGELEWSASWNELFNESVCGPKEFLLNNNTLGLKDQNNLFLLNLNSKKVIRQHLGTNANYCPVVLGDNSVLYFKNGIFASIVGYDGKILQKPVNVDGRKDWTILQLAFPREQDILTVNQFTGGPRRKPKSYCIGLQGYKLRDRKWVKKNKGEILNALINNDLTKLIVIYCSRIEIFSIDKGNLITSTDFNDFKINSSCMDTDDNIVLEISDHNDKHSIKVVDCQLLPKWGFSVSNIFLNIPPACGIDNRIYIIDKSILKCLINGKELWNSKLVGIQHPFLTISNCNKTFIVSLNSLLCFDENGVKLHSIILATDDEKFVLPAIISGDGKVFVGGSKRLYCFK